MLKSLSISNYILIDALQIDFSTGFTTITGETGAGKSIILGALALVTGDRADNQLIRNRERKCVVEAVFSGLNFPEKSFFENHQIDEQPELILRREILPAGTSRSFINDCPVTLQVLKEAGRGIIDIHSQHQNLLLNNNRFQLGVIDAIAGTQKVLEEYVAVYQEYTRQLQWMEELTAKQEKAEKDLDYIRFQYSQLNEANLKDGEQESLEGEQKMLAHAGEIIETVSRAMAVLNDEHGSVYMQLKEVKNMVARIAEPVERAEQWLQRIESLMVEIRDIAGEMETVAAKVEADPGRLENVEERLSQIYSLLFKYKEKSVADLIRERDGYRQRMHEIENYSAELDEVRKRIAAIKKDVDERSEKLSKKRRLAIPEFNRRMSALAAELGMPHASLMCRISPLPQPGSFGCDDLRFLFTSNPQIDPVEISKAASGGELSRIMLCLKTIIASSNRMPTLIFDEIDTGLSGEVAHRMSLMMKQLADGLQVIAITHLPQIAAAGKEHILVYKVTENSEAHTFLKKLNREERLAELAKMLSGKKVTPAAIKNAEELMKQSR